MSHLVEYKLVKIDCRVTSRWIWTWERSKRRPRLSCNIWNWHLQVYLRDQLVIEKPPKFHVEVLGSRKYECRDRAWPRWGPFDLNGPSETTRRSLPVRNWITTPFVNINQPQLSWSPPEIGESIPRIKTYSHYKTSINTGFDPAKNTFKWSPFIFDNWNSNFWNSKHI